MKQLSHVMLLGAQLLSPCVYGGRGVVLFLFQSVLLIETRKCFLTYKRGGVASLLEALQWLPWLQALQGGPII